MERLLQTVDAYTALRPAYLTVTFGAGGKMDNVENARKVVKAVAERTHLPVAAHVTCASRSRADIDAIIDSFWRDGVRQVVALRGDMLAQGEPFQHHPDGYKTTPEFIAAIRKRYPSIQIAVAGYPETHPDAVSEAADIEYLKRKLDAGADTVLTQMFFDPDVFLRWRDNVASFGISAPLIPGLLPIFNFPKLLTFAQKCNAKVPAFLHTMFANVEPESVDHKLLAMNVLSHQITRLIENGVRSFHFYTLNETLLTRHVCTWLRAGF